MHDQSDAVERIPQAVEAELDVLGVLLVNGEAISSVVDVLKPADFYREPNRAIYRAMLDLHAAEAPVDIVTVSEKLKAQERLEDIGGRKYLAEVASGFSTALNLDYHARMIVEQSQLRQLIKGCAEISRAARSDAEVGKVLEQAHQVITDLYTSAAPVDGLSLEEKFDAIYSETEKRAAGEIQPSILSGFVDIDNILGGFEPGELDIIAARPSMGKTALILAIAANVAERSGKRTAIFSIEMPEQDLLRRLLSSQSGVDLTDIRRGTVPADGWPVLIEAIQAMKDWPITIFDDPVVTLARVEGKIRRMFARGEEPGAVVIDHIGLMVSENPEKENNRTIEIGKFSRGLKRLARELQVPIIALSQLSRAVEGRQDKRPILADLRDSGNIEQDADKVAFLYRDDYYNPESEDRGVVEFLVRKNRNGPTGTARLAFRRETGSFFDLAGFGGSTNAQEGTYRTAAGNARTGRFRGRGRTSYALGSDS